jgi:hypothetical protein
MPRFMSLVCSEKKVTFEMHVQVKELRSAFRRLLRLGLGSSCLSGELSRGTRQHEL